MKSALAFGPLLAVLALPSGCALFGVRDDTTSSFHPSYRATQDRAKLPGPALVLPIQDCSAVPRQGVVIDERARKLAKMVFPSAFWSTLHLPGAPQETADADTDALCALVNKERYSRNAEWRAADPASWSLDLLERQTVARILAKYPDRQSIVVMTRTMWTYRPVNVATVRDAQGFVVGTYENGTGAVRETGDVRMNLFLIGREAILIRLTGQCGPNNPYPCTFDHGDDEVRRVMSRMAEGFPWHLIGLSAGPEGRPADNAVAATSVLAIAPTPPPRAATQVPSESPKARVKSTKSKHP